LTYQSLDKQQALSLLVRVQVVVLATGQRAFSFCHLEG